MSDLFELREDLPNKELAELGSGLIGFEARYERLERAFRMLLDPESVRAWAKKFHGVKLPIVEILAQRYPLVILHGDVGTGKTVFAEASADRLCRDNHLEGTLLKLSTRVRGTGKVGQLSHLINEAFDEVVDAVGKKRAAVLVIDEADSLGASRDQDQSHHEDKVGVNTLIQKIDDVRRLKGRLLVFLSTNRFQSLDPALTRRAGHIEKFARPNDAERKDLLLADTMGLGLSDDTINRAVKLTGPKENEDLGFTFSDLRTRLIPEAVLRAYPERALTDDDLLGAAGDLDPSPAIDGLDG